MKNPAQFWARRRGVRRRSKDRHRAYLVVQALEERALLAAPSLFVNVNQPGGMTTDSAGDVFISSVQNTPMNTSSVITEFSPQGAKLSQVTVSSGIVVFPGSLAMLSASATDLSTALAPGDILDLSPGGQVLAYRPSTGALGPFLNIASLPSIDTSSIYDVSTGRTSGFAGAIIPQLAMYGDIAVLGNTMLVTGVSQNFPFVLRLQMSNGVVTSAKVLLSSSVPTSNNLPRGVAVNARGLALTTLPITAGGSEGNPDLPVGFGISFDAGQGPAPHAVSSQYVDSRGMAIDSLGNFLIATGPGGSALCSTTQAVVTASANLTRFACVPVLSPSSLNSSAVAVSPDNGTVYLAFNDIGQAWRSDSIPLPAVQDDFTGGGKTSMAVFRPPTAEWFISGVGGTQFGAPGLDLMEPADYTGDGKTELAVFRPPTAQWFVAGAGSIQYGMTGDLAVPGDYDGDGKADYAVYRPSTGQWFIFGSRGGPRVIQFGTPGLDIPIPADYDGDGKIDLALYRPTTGQWFIAGPSGGTQVIQFGGPGDVPVPANYFGDGKDDLAVYRPSTGTWYFRGVGHLQAGMANVDIPVPADYMGVGRAELALYRPTTAQWFIAGMGVFQFGEPNVDVPVTLPIAYRSLGSGQSILRSAGALGGQGNVSTGSQPPPGRMPRSLDAVDSSAFALVPIVPADPLSDLLGLAAPTSAQRRRASSL